MCSSGRALVKPTLQMWEELESEEALISEVRTSEEWQSEWKRIPKGKEKQSGAGRPWKVKAEVYILDLENVDASGLNESAFVYSWQSQEHSPLSNLGLHFIN